MEELFDGGDATAIAGAVAAGEVSAREVLEEALARLEERNPVLNAVIARRDDAARAEVATGLPAGPLRGVPIVIKDLGATVAGMPATGGSRLFADVVAREDSEIVARYRRAGAVVVGMTNTPELGRNASTEPLLYGPTRNPHRLTHSPGGSSGGTAAAVAAGIVPAGHANDGGGSIRIPASACGLIGLKPSRGRTPGSPRFTAMAYPLAVNHALCRTVRDCALLLDVAEGPVAGDPYVVAPPARPYRSEVGAPPGRCRVGVSWCTPSGGTVDPDCRRAVEKAAALLAEAGHEVVEAAPEWPVDDLQASVGVFLAVPLAVEIDDRLAELGRELADGDLEPLTRMLHEAARQVTGHGLVRAHQSLERAARQVGEFFGECDLLLCPTMARRVPPLGLLDTSDLAAMGRHAADYAALTSPFNVTGQPAISLPVGTDRDSLPVGVQLVAAWGREDLLLRVAAQLEATGTWDPRPVWPPSAG